MLRLIQDHFDDAAARLLPRDVPVFCLGELLGPVSGFVLDDRYVAGDTIWRDEVAEAIERHRPSVAVVNGSGAR
jgi:hypothetical protein